MGAALHSHPPERGKGDGRRDLHQSSKGHLRGPVCLLLSGDGVSTERMPPGVCAWETETYDGRKLEDGDFLFRRKGCRLPITPSTFTWRFKLILKKHGLPEYLNAHSLRHTNASLLIANGTDVATVAGLLGHSQPSTTFDIYTHAFEKNKQAASKVLQEGLEI